MTAPIWATSRADPRRSSRAVNDCCSVGGMAWMPPCSPPRSRRRRVTSSTNSGTPPVRAATSSITSRGSAWRAESSATMCAYLGAVKRRERDGTVMRPHAPRRPELRPRRRHDEQRRQRATLGKAAEHIERRRIGPMQVLERQHHRLNPCTRDHPAGQRRELSSPQFLRRQSRRAFLW